MATRTNIDTNSACKNDAAGWSGGTRVTSLTGLPRTTGLQSTGSDLQTPRVDIVPGQTYRFSVYVKGSGGASTGTTNINWYNGGSYHSSGAAQPWSVTNGGVTRLDSGAEIAPPSGADSALLTVEGIDNVIQVTAVLAEATTELYAFFDGDSPTASYLGADGNSESILPELSVSLSGIGSGAAFGTAIVQPQITATGIASGQGLGSAVVTIGQTVAAFGVASGRAIGSPTVTIFPILVQARQEFIASGTLSKSVTFPALTATAGNVIGFCFVGNRDVGTFTLAGTGWNYTVNLRQNRLSLVIAWKVAAGGESGASASWTQGNDAGSQCWLAEYSSTESGTWVTKGSATNNTTGTNTVDVSTGTSGTLIGSGVSVALFGVENVLSDSTDAVSNSYTLRFSQGGGVFESGIWVADKPVLGGTTTETTLSRTSPVTASPMSAGLVVLGKAVPTTVTPTGISSGQAVGSPSILALYPTGIPTGEQLGSPSVALTVFTISPSGISSARAIGTHVVHSGPLLLLTGIPSGQAFGTPSVDYPARDVLLGSLRISAAYLGVESVDVMYLGSSRVLN